MIQLHSLRVILESSSSEIPLQLYAPSFLVQSDVFTRFGFPGELTYMLASLVCVLLQRTFASTA